jgi:hypothetical protein
VRVNLVAAVAGLMVLAAAAPALSAEAGTKTTRPDLIFECARGEKPGSPTFVLTVAGRAVTASRPGKGPFPEQTQHRMLTDAEWTALEHAVAAARPDELDKKYRGGKEGRCSLTYTLASPTVDVGGPTSNPTWCSSFKDLLGWIAALEVGAPERVDPILPPCVDGPSKGRAKSP